MSDRQNTIRNRRIRLVLKFVLALGVVALMVHYGMLDAQRVASVSSKPYHLAAGALLILAGLVLTIFRWQALLAVQDIRPGTREVLRLGFIGFFFSCVIPGSVGGDAVKAYYVAKDHGKAAQSVATVLLDRFIGLYTFVIMAGVAILFCRLTGLFEGVWSNPEVIVICWLVFGLAGGMTLFFAAVFSRTAKNSRAVNWLLDHLPFQKTVRSLYDAVYLYRDNRRALAVIGCLSVGAQIPMIVAHFILGSALLQAAGEIALNLPAYFFLASLGLVINSVPVLPAGIGTGQAGYKILFDALGSGIGAELATLWHLIFIGWSGIGMILYVKGRNQYRMVSQQSADMETPDAKDG